MIGHSTCIHEDKFFIFGGRDKSGSYHSELIFFDLIKETIETLKTHIFPRAAHSMAVVNAKIYIFGGVSEINQGMPIYLNDLHIYDIKKRAWNKIKKKNAPSGRAGHYTCAIGTDLFLFGGRNSKKVHDDAYIFNTNNNTWSLMHMANSMPKRIGASMSLLKEKYVVMWGGSDLFGNFTEDLEIFDIARQRWTSIKPFGESPGLRSWHTCNIVETKLYVFGGYSNKKSMNDVWYVDLVPLVVNTKEKHFDVNKLEKIKMKLIFVHDTNKKEKRVLLLPSHANLVSLKETIQKEFDVKKVTLSYIDEEGEEVTIGSDLGLESALDFFREGQKDFVLTVKAIQQIVSDTFQLNGMRYIKLTPPLGKGKFATVWEAIDIDNCRFFAIKEIEIERQIKEEILKEVTVLKSLDHINIIKFLDYSISDKILYILMEKAPHGSLASHFERLHKQAKERRQFESFNVNFEMEMFSRSFIKQILLGLQYLHSKTIIHRDIKGRNILLGNDGVKIADFGLSDSVEKLQELCTKEIKGTLQFMAPESLKYEYTTKCDIWGLGCTLIEMITGFAPFHELIREVEEFQFLVKLRDEDLIPKIPKISSQGQDFLSKCFERDPRQRPSAQDLLKHKFVTEKLCSDENYPQDDEELSLDFYSEDEETSMTFTSN